MSTTTTARDTRFKHPPRYGCSGCRQDFTSLTLFDRHRHGSFDGNGRRCRSTEEMTKRGWLQDEHGRWFEPEARARVKAAFAE